ncbi:MAG: DNA methyltransferase, partial [Anaerolineae bacterium]|nr:DNA methyltransferase [Anaerolineae bacterium]
AEQSRKRLGCGQNSHNIHTSIITGDSTQLDYAALLHDLGIQAVDLIILHPPYHDIIRFSDDAVDLSNKPDVATFLDGFRQVVHHTFPILTPGRFLVVVIGDKFEHGEWIPLGFYAMQAVLDEGYKLKSIIVKNYDQTKGKRDQTQLWRYRALAGGFYIFKHEYIYVFQKEML